MIHFDVQSKAVSEYTGDTLLHLHQHLRLIGGLRLWMIHFDVQSKVVSNPHYLSHPVPSSIAVFDDDEVVEIDLCQMNGWYSRSVLYGIITSMANAAGCLKWSSA